MTASVLLAGAKDPVRGIPARKGGVAVVSIVIGDSNALGWDTSTHDMHIVADPHHCRIWGKWGSSIVERYICPTRTDDELAKLTENTGQHHDGTTVLTIGPEQSLGAVRYKQLLSDCVSKRQKLEHVTVKLAIPGAVAFPTTSPRSTWHPPLDADDERRDSLLPPFVAALDNSHSNAHMLVSEYLLPAIAALRAEGKLVLIDAVYLNLGGNDCVAAPGYEEAPRNLATHIEALLDFIGVAVGTKSLSLVASLPLFNAAHAPLERTELARQQLERWAANDVRVQLVKVDDMAVQPDLVHFGTQGQVGHGMRWADVWTRSVARLFEPVVPDVEAEREEEIVEGSGYRPGMGEVLYDYTQRGKGDEPVTEGAA